MLILQNVSYTFPNKSIAFENIGFRLAPQEKVALVGNNGVGKSTLLHLISGHTSPSHGQIQANGSVYFVPQVFGQYNHLTIAEALGVQEKLIALDNILKGSINENDYLMLDDDWAIEERCQQALNAWGLEDIALRSPIEKLSGGQKTKVFLAGIAIHDPQLVLLDEPSNHLDASSREKLYNYISQSNKTMLIVSHDRQLLDLLDITFEMTPHGITRFGGNYEFYLEQKNVQLSALADDIGAKEKEIRKAKLKERETAERQNRQDSRGQRKQEKEGVARIMMNTLKNKAENSTSKLKAVHQSKITDLNKDLTTLRSSVPDLDKMKFDFQNMRVHEGKTLFEAKDIQVIKNDRTPLWPTPINILIRGGQRIAIQGDNGSGKTTLLKIILKQMIPQEGKCFSAFEHAVYVDQEYALLDNKLTLFEQAQLFNDSGLQPAEINTRLKRFLFQPDDWNKPVSVLSGGERLRLTLCCLTVSPNAPDLIILDEPTNNLDLQNVRILTHAINSYEGTLIVVSHDATFLEDIGIKDFIQL
ncbi:ABC-F family ATP-binding cassette domain-containing protein [Sphingobacterium tabacisoli]|uniref:ABC-F family ATP-binding cassette domain-containing protein n=1 Tax=Sphingobacterium tabacisoli TaxID=2044855 RepID=A0ABW5L0Y5_9SPHI|nr:ABC-F family ATP-binding cassette domain-containing protein [Sphingobacterium tabacisoli]